MQEQRKLKKKKWSPQSVVAIMFFLLAIIVYLLFVLFYSNYVSFDTIVADDALDRNELSYLSAMNCAQIKAMLGTEKNICIYAKDPEGNIVPLIKDKIGIGCPGVMVDGVNVCG